MTELTFGLERAREPAFGGAGRLLRFLIAIASCQYRMGMKQLDLLSELYMKVGTRKKRMRDGRFRTGRRVRWPPL